jgi:outer membrane protein assembly factor BamB
LDPASGKTLWRHFRPSKARAESREAFTTPIPLEYDGRVELLIAGGDALTGHDPETGKELWRWGTWNPERIPHWRLVTSPVAGGGVILACAPKRDPIYAVKAGGVGLLADDALAWVSTEQREISTDVPTPAFYDGDFFVLSDVRRCLSRVEPQTGKIKWTVETPGRTKYEASPLAADGKIYLMNFDGEVAMVNAGDGKLLKVIPMDRPEEGEKVRASIVASDGQLFIRTARTLYCVGQRN